MNPVATQQIALDNSLVVPKKRLKIEKCSARIAFSKPQREETYQVTLIALKLSPCDLAFWSLLKSLKYTCINSGTPSERSKTQMHIDSSWIRKSSELTLTSFVKFSSLGEHLMRSSIGASLGRQQDLIGLENHELKSCMLSHSELVGIEKVAVCFSL
nr:hypothetical protein [Tanacetum cinerariifolium]